MKEIIRYGDEIFYFLSYDPNYKVKNLIVVPNYFLQYKVIEKRKPLPITAKRPGWIGCNILLDQTPEIGKIKLIENSQCIKHNVVQKIWQKTIFLGQQNQVESRGWLLEVMKCIDMLGMKSFNLQHLYTYESYLSQRHPNNHHMKLDSNCNFFVTKDIWNLKNAGFIN